VGFEPTNAFARVLSLGQASAETFCPLDLFRYPRVVLEHSKPWVDPYMTRHFELFEAPTQPFLPNLHVQNRSEQALIATGRWF